MSSTATMSNMPARSTRPHAAAVVRGAVGQSGNNEDYVLSTLEHLEALGIRDHWLEDVAQPDRAFVKRWPVGNDGQAFDLGDGRT